MKTKKLILSFAIILSLSACSAVYSTHPVGDSPLILKSADWEGTWISAEGTLVTRIADTAGILEAAWIDKIDTGLKYESVRAHLMTWQDWVFINIENEDDQGNTRYVWGRVKKKGRLVLLWAPDLEKIKALVNAGDLPGRVDNGDVILDPLSPSQMKRLTAPDKELLFDWEEPLVLIRMGD